MARRITERTATGIPGLDNVFDDHLLKPVEPGILEQLLLDPGD